MKVTTEYASRTAYHLPMGRIRTLETRVSRMCVRGDAWADLTRWLSYLDTHSVGQPAYILSCIASAQRTAANGDSPDSRAEIYADMELIELYICGAYRP